MSSLTLAAEVVFISVSSFSVVVLDSGILEPLDEKHDSRRITPKTRVCCCGQKDEVASALNDVANGVDVVDDTKANKAAAWRSRLGRKETEELEAFKARWGIMKNIYIPVNNASTNRAFVHFLARGGQQRALRTKKDHYLAMEYVASDR
jgi:hypothetical protein